MYIDLAIKTLHPTLPDHIGTVSSDEYEEHIKRLEPLCGVEEGDGFGIDTNEDYVEIVALYSKDYPDRLFILDYEDIDDFPTSVRYYVTNGKYYWVYATYPEFNPNANFRGQA